MTTFIFRRLIESVFVLILVSLIVFYAMRLLPGDPIRMLITQNDQQQATEEEIKHLRHEFGLDRPLIVQYTEWISNAIRRDLGTSILLREPVAGEIFRRIPITFHLSILAFIFSIIVGIPAGIVCAVRRGTWIDTIITFLSNIGMTVPIFWLGLILMYIFALNLRWLPVFGYTSPLDNFWMSTKQVIMPVFCLAVFPIASATRQTRSSMLEVMHQDYIRTAWSKGLSERVVVIGHAVKNALIPVITLKGLSLSMILGGSVLIETVFNIPGMGRLAISSVLNQDYPIVQGVILIISITVVLSNLIIDLTYGWLDPRIRYE